MIAGFVPLGATVALALLPLGAIAAEAAPPSIVVSAPAPAPRTISLTTAAHVTYAPDLADLSLGVRSEAGTAADAANRTNAAGARLLAALERLGIAKTDVQTTQYDVTFVPAQTPITTGPVIRQRPGHPASYIVATTFAVKAPIAKAGDAIDAAIAAGANDSYGLTFESSHIDDYYAQALASAMKSAHARALALASAAGVALDALQSVATTGGPSANAPAPAPEISDATVARFKKAPIASGTQSVDASVDVVYTIK